MLRLLTSSLLVTLTAASFCGDSTVPFSLEVLPNGQPVLGCARPTCFGWAPTGHPASNGGAFYRINDHADGFIRPGRESIPAFGSNDARFYRPFAAMCEPAFASVGCPGANQWVGGIAPLLNLTAYPTMLQCCAYDALLQSEDRGIATLVGGQIAQGGEVFSGNVQIAFDYISDVAKIVRADGTISYDVAIRRMPCADVYDPNVKQAAGAGAQAFQAPITSAEQPIPLPRGSGEGAGSGETGPAGGSGEVGPAPPQQQPPAPQVLEEVVQEEAFQLPPGTQFQPPPPPQFQPPPFQQPQFVPQPAPYYPQYSYGAGGGGNNQWCFTEDMTVETIEGVHKRMDELEKGDWILAASDMQMEYVPVEFWLHRVPAQEAEFNEFETEDGKTIKLTDKHYIFKGDCSQVGTGAIDVIALSQTAVTADSVHAGDCLYTVKEDKSIHEVRVVRSGKVTQTGIYAPMTSSGRVVVNGIHASCHNIMQANAVQQTSFEALNKIYERFFGAIPQDVVETPSTLSTLIAMAEIIFPKNLVTL